MQMAGQLSAISVTRRIIDAAIVTLVALVLVGLVLGRLVPLTGRQTLIIGGRSMEPAIALGSAVIIEPVAPADLVVGDVVTLRVGSKPSIFTHRVTRLATVDGLSYIETKGDANGAPDGAITPASAVVGREIVSIPLAGYLLAFLSVPIGIVFTLCLAASLVIAAALLDLIERDRAALRSPSRRERQASSWPA